MSECRLDHTLGDVQNKLTEQAPFLPADLVEETRVFLQTEPAQSVLNEIFHLLKKYDLAPSTDRSEREQKLRRVLAGGQA